MDRYILFILPSTIPYKMTITVDILKAIAPGSKKTNYKHLPGLALWMNHWFPQFDIDTKGELCHFVCQAAHETDSFNSLEEYASGDAYDTRVDLGNTPQEDGDGRKFKGSGIFMTTGRANYRIATIRWNEDNKDDYQNFNTHPEKLREPKYAVWSACQFWDHKGFNVVANMPDSSQVIYKKNKLVLNVSPVEYISRVINGGINGLEERKMFYQRAKAVLI
jgi:putative chitinase